MKTLTLILMLGMVGCAHGTIWKPTASAKTNLAEAHNDCKVKMAVAVKPESDLDVTLSYRQKQFMQECMAGQGFERS